MYCSTSDETLWGIFFPSVWLQTDDIREEELYKRYVMSLIMVITD